MEAGSDQNDNGQQCMFNWQYAAYSKLYSWLVAAGSSLLSSVEEAEAEADKVGQSLMLLTHLTHGLCCLQRPTISVRWPLGVEKVSVGNFDSISTLALQSFL